jgi:hypothetical protein
VSFKNRSRAFLSGSEAEPRLPPVPEPCLTWLITTCDGCRVQGSFIVTASEHLRRGFAELEMTTYPTGTENTAGGHQVNKGADSKCNGSTHVNSEDWKVFLKL